MTDEQFEKFLSVQIAQLAMLQGIYNNVQTVAMSSGKASGHNWKDIDDLLKNAIAVAKKM